MLSGFDAAGALIAGIALEARGLLRAHPRTAFVLTAMWCVCIAGFAAAPAYPLALALLLAAGFCNLSFNALALLAVTMARLGFALRVAQA